MHLASPRVGVFVRKASMESNTVFIYPPLMSDLSFSAKNLRQDESGHVNTHASYNTTTGIGDGKATHEAAHLVGEKDISAQSEMRFYWTPYGIDHVSLSHFLTPSQEGHDRGFDIYLDCAASDDPGLVRYGMENKEPVRFIGYICHMNQRQAGSLLLDDHTDGESSSYFGSDFPQSTDKPADSIDQICIALSFDSKANPDVEAIYAGLELFCNSLAILEKSSLFLSRELVFIFKHYRTVVDYFNSNHEELSPGEVSNSQNPLPPLASSASQAFHLILYSFWVFSDTLLIRSTLCRGILDFFVNFRNSAYMHTRLDGYLIVAFPKSLEFYIPPVTSALAVLGGFSTVKNLLPAEDLGLFRLVLRHAIPRKSILDLEAQLCVPRKALLRVITYLLNVKAAKTLPKVNDEQVYCLNGSVKDEQILFYAEHLRKRFGVTSVQLSVLMGLFSTGSRIRDAKTKFLSTMQSTISFSIITEEKATEALLAIFYFMLDWFILTEVLLLKKIQLQFRPSIVSVTHSPSFFPPNLQLKEAEGSTASFSFTEKPADSSNLPLNYHQLKEVSKQPWNDFLIEKTEKLPSSGGYSMRIPELPLDARILESPAEESVFLEHFPSGVYNKEGNRLVSLKEFEKVSPRDPYMQRWRGIRKEGEAEGGAFSPRKNGQVRHDAAMSAYSNGSSFPYPEGQSSQPHMTFRLASSSLLDEDILSSQNEDSSSCTAFSSSPPLPSESIHVSSPNLQNLSFSNLESRLSSPFRAPSLPFDLPFHAPNFHHTPPKYSQASFDMPVVLIPHSTVTYVATLLRKQLSTSFSLKNFSDRDIIAIYLFAKEQLQLAAIESSKREESVGLHEEESGRSSSIEECAKEAEDNMETRGVIHETAMAQKEGGVSLGQVHNSADFPENLEVYKEESDWWIDEEDVESAFSMESSVEHLSFLDTRGSFQSQNIESSANHPLDKHVKFPVHKERFTTSGFFEFCSNLNESLLADAVEIEAGLHPSLGGVLLFLYRMVDSFFWGLAASLGDRTTHLDDHYENWNYENDFCFAEGCLSKNPEMGEMFDLLVIGKKPGLYSDCIEVYYVNPGRNAENSSRINERKIY